MKWQYQKVSGIFIKEGSLWQSFEKIVFYPRLFHKFLIYIWSYCVVLINTKLHLHTTRWLNWKIIKYTIISCISRGEKNVRTRAWSQSQQTSDNDITGRLVGADLAYLWWPWWQWCRTVGPFEHGRASGGRIHSAPLDRVAGDAARESRAGDVSPWLSSSYRSILVPL